MKTLDDYFRDWESHVFGFGYGSGDQYTLAVLKRFLELCPASGCYDYTELEQELGAPVAWLMINILCKAGIIEYGTSPRFAWLDSTGRRLKEFVSGRTVQELYDLVMFDDDSPYYECGPDYCNCGPNGHEQGRVCQNPFWMDPE
jgi:hypothetical protein